MALKEVLKFLIGISIIGGMIYAIVTHKGSSYNPDASALIIADEIEENRIDDYKYKMSLEGKYDNKETDTTITEDGDMVIFYVTTDTIKKKIR